MRKSSQQGGNCTVLPCGDCTCLIVAELAVATGWFTYSNNHAADRQAGMTAPWGPAWAVCIPVSKQTGGHRRQHAAQALVYQTFEHCLGTKATDVIVLRDQPTAHVNIDMCPSCRFLHNYFCSVLLMNRLCAWLKARPKCDMFYCLVASAPHIGPFETQIERNV